MVKVKESTPGNKKINKRKSNIDNGDRSPAKLKKTQDFNNLTPSNKGDNKSPVGKQGSSGKQLNKNNKGNKGGISKELNNSVALNKMNNKQKKAATANSEESSEDEDILNKSNILQSDSEDSESEEEVDLGNISKSSAINMNAVNAEGDDSEESDSEEEVKVVLGNGQNEAEANNESGESVEESELNETGVSQADNLSASNKFRDSDLNDEQIQRTICIRNFHPSLNSECLKMFFSKYGKIEQAKTHVTRVMITFTKRKYALKSLEVNGMEYKQHHLLVKMYIAQNDIIDRDVTNAVRVDYGSLRMDWNSTYKLFSDCGIISDVCIIGSTAYVWFESAEAVTLALAKSKSLVKNGMIIVEKADKEGFLSCKKKYEDFKKNKRLNTPRFNTSGNFRNMGRGPRSGFMKRGGNHFTRMH